MPCQTQPRTNRGVVGIPVHQQFILLVRCQLGRHPGDDPFPRGRHFPAAGGEQQVAVDRVIDRPLQPVDMRLGGGGPLLKRLVFPLKLLVLRFQIVVDALRDAGGEEERPHEGQQQGAAFQSMCGHVRILPVRQPSHRNARPLIPSSRIDMDQSSSGSLVTFLAWSLSYLLYTVLRCPFADPLHPTLRSGWQHGRSAERCDGPIRWRRQVPIAGRRSPPGVLHLRRCPGRMRSFRWLSRLPQPPAPACACPRAGRARGRRGLRQGGIGAMRRDPLSPAGPT